MLERGYIPPAWRGSGLIHVYLSPMDSTAPSQYRQTPAGLSFAVSYESSERGGWGFPQASRFWDEKSSKMESSTMAKMNENRGPLGAVSLCFFSLLDLLLWCCDLLELELRCVFLPRSVF